ncbi:MAG: prepilin-type N-terminal cleavage/methylation domain-containing protein [Candidatus Gracilibacteria bacterium]|nr:prepilin-type N-terminal cleavage/methylation domain-containing protein [Candidatus Gracilibacteria bacterium]
MKRTQQAMTLVELLVVILILGILSTLSFIAYSGWLETARNATRISKINSIEKSFDMNLGVNGRYFKPEDASDISFAGTELAKKGVIGTEIAEKINTKDLVDPTDQSFFDYATSNDRLSYQVRVFLEDSGEQIPMVSGRYNKGFVMGKDKKYYAMPSLFPSEDIVTSGVTFDIDEETVPFEVVSIQDQFGNDFVMNDIRKDHRYDVFALGLVAAYGGNSSGINESFLEKKDYIMLHATDVTDQEAITKMGKFVIWNDKLPDRPFGSTAVAVGGSLTNSYTFPDIEVVMTVPLQLYAGPTHMCGKMSDLTVRCWGKNDEGQLGDGTTDLSFEPVEVTQPGVTYTTVDHMVLGEQNTCAVFVDNTVSCWGEEKVADSNNSGNADLSSLTDVNTVSIGTEHACVLLNSGTVSCWGENSSGQIGDGGTTTMTNPADTTLSDINQIDVAGNMSCAKDTSGDLFCWGNYVHHDTGVGGELRNSENSSTPLLMSGIGSVSDFSLGGLHICAINGSSDLKCWGDKGSSRLGFYPSGGTTFHRRPSSHTTLADVKDIEVSRNHSCAITNSDEVYCWGLEKNGQIGNNNTWSSGSPTENTPYFVDISSTGTPEKLLLGATSTLVEMDNNKRYGWGGNLYGALGFSAYSRHMSNPLELFTSENGNVTLSKGTLEFPKIYSGDDHSCAILGDYTVKCWGGNSQGELGNGTTDRGYKPSLVQGIDKDVIDMAIGWNHSCVLLIDRTVQCWGYNAYGQVGDGSSGNIITEATIVPGLNDVFDIVLGYSNSCVIKSDGKLYCWGGNSNGILGMTLGDGGDGSTSPSLLTVPTLVPGLQGVTKVVLSGNHSCALSGDHVVICWGRHSGGNQELGSGELGGLGTNGDYGQIILSNLGQVSDISIAKSHTCVIMLDKTVTCWGLNTSYQLGRNGHWNRVNYGMTVGAGAEKLIIHRTTSCAIDTLGDLYCWGTVNGTSQPTPVLVSSDIKEIVLGHGHYFIQNTNNKYSASGNNSLGKLGFGALSNDYENIPIPLETLTFGSSVSLQQETGSFPRIYTGKNHACALAADGSVSCWGENSSGQLGNGTTTSTDTPVLVTDLLGPVVSLGLHSDHSCAVINDGSIQCWGSNGSGRLGNGTNSSSNTPVTVLNIENAHSVSIGSNFSCALTTDAEVKCWGSGGSGKLGRGSNASSNIPVDVIGLDGVQQIVTGDSHSCALMINHMVSCWGAGGSTTYRKLGHSNLLDKNQPWLVSELMNVKQISSMGSHTCAVLIDGGVKCWGYNNHGQKGNGNISTVGYATDVVGLTGINIEKVDVGSVHTCAYSDTGDIYCWGRNNNNQLTSSAGSSENTPYHISTLSNIVRVNLMESTTFATASDGTIHVWGTDSGGQFGNAGGNDSTGTPTVVTY